MRRHFFALPLLFLAGCSSRQASKPNYEAQLGLAPLATPNATFAPPTMVTSTAMRPIEEMENAIQNAATPALAVASTSTIMQGARVITALTGSKDKESQWFLRASEYYDRAAKIKKLQLEKGDTSDSTGEVARYIALGHQSYNNSLHFSPTPAPTPALNPGITVKVHSMRQAKVFLTGDKQFPEKRIPDEGKVFLIVNLTATYTGSGECKVNHDAFRLFVNGHVYESETFFTMWSSAPLIRATLTKGGSTTGNVVFEVEPNEKTGKVEYRNNWLAMTRGGK